MMSVHKLPNVGPRAKQYEVRWRNENGRPRSKRFHKHGEAVAHDDGIRQRKRAGEAVDPSIQDMTIGEFYREHFLPTRRVSQGTRDGYAERWTTVDPKRRRIWHLVEKWDGVSLRTANRPEAVDSWHDEMRRAGASDARMFRSHDLFMAIIGVAVEYDYLPRNRVSGRYPEYTPARAAAPWLPEEIETVRAEYLARSMTPRRYTNRGSSGDWSEYRWRRRRDAEITSFLGYQACRPGEALALKWPRVLNDERSGIALAVEIVDTVSAETRERTKTHEDRSVTLNAHVRSDLRAWWTYCGKPTNGLVFPRSPDGEAWTKLSMSNWSKYWCRALEDMGLERVTVKHLRHSCVSMWVRAGMDVGSVADEAGHSVQTCLRTYRHGFKKARLAPDDRFDMDAAIAQARERRGNDDALPLRRVV
jgi:integrase